MAVIPLAGAPISFSDASLSSFRQISACAARRMPPNAGMNRRQFSHATALAATAARCFPKHPPRRRHAAKPCAGRSAVSTAPGSRTRRSGPGHRAGRHQGRGLQADRLAQSVRQGPFIGSDATPEYLANLSSGSPRAACGRTWARCVIKSNAPLADQIKDARQQIDNAKTLSLEFLLTFGAGNQSNTRTTTR